MEKVINRILETNNLFDENGEININSCNKIEDFLRTYEFNGSRKNFLPKDIIRDKNGRIILDEIPFIVSNTNINDNDDNKWIILNNGSKLLLKQRDYDEFKIYNEIEIILMYLFKSLNMKCANYDLATLNGKEILITPSFLQNNERIITFNKKDSVFDIKKFYETAKEYGLQSHYLKTIFVDKIYGNIDRFPKNFGAIEGGFINKRKRPYRICPLFDNAEKNAMLIRDFKYADNVYVDSDKYYSTDIIFNYLLGNEEIMHWVKNIMSKTNLYEIMKKIKYEKGISISRETYDKISGFFKDSEDIINDELKNKGQSFKIKLI